MGVWRQFRGGVEVFFGWFWVSECGFGLMISVGMSWDVVVRGSGVGLGMVLGWSCGSSLGMSICRCHFTNVGNSEQFGRGHILESFLQSLQYASGPPRIICSSLYVVRAL